MEKHNIFLPTKKKLQTPDCGLVMSVTLQKTTTITLCQEQQAEEQAEAAQFIQHEFIVAAG